MSIPESAQPTRRARARRTWAFWIALAAFLAWDFNGSAPIDLRDEPPLIAAGSGRANSGGHCSMSK
jgi:hypothetical protein